MPNKGCKHSEEARDKIRASKLGSKNPMFGKHPSEETRKKMQKAHSGERNHNFGKPMTKKQREKLSLVMSEENNPNFGKHHSDETRRKISERISEVQKGRIPTSETCAKLSERAKGRKLSPESCKKIGDSMRGERNTHWKGGISFEPYCPKFTKGLRERVRAFFDYTCVECGNPQNGIKLAVHHVNFNKETCCDSSTPLFVALCTSCHMKTNGHREYWVRHFTEIIKGFYQGKCYLTEDGMVDK